MTIFITQGRYSRQVSDTTTPQDRARAAAALYRAAGARMIEYYATFGDYDFLIIGEADEGEALLGALTAAGLGGDVTDVKTTLGVKPDARSAHSPAAALAPFRLD